MSTITFESIQQSINGLDPQGVTARTAAADAPSSLERLFATYRAVRPIFAALALVPLVPPQWRDALRLFVATFDQFTDAPSAAGDFKAGKDL